MIAASKVLLPLPTGPTIASNCPLGTLRLMSRRARMSLVHSKSPSCISITNSSRDGSGGPRGICGWRGGSSSRVKNLC